MMNGNHYYRVKYGMPNAPKVRKLRQNYHGSSLEALGLWVLLMDTLYQTGGSFELDEINRNDLMHEAGLSESELENALTLCARVDLIDAGMYERGMVGSAKIVEQLDFSKAQSERGKAGAKARAKAGAKAGA